MNDTAVNVIHAALSEELFDADGDPLELELLPGLTEAEIDALQWCGPSPLVYPAISR
jgi:hypothetical protein